MKEADEMYNAMFSDYPDIVDVKQLQKMLGVSRHLIYDLISDKKISAVKIGHSFRIPKVNVIKYVMSGS